VAIHCSGRARWSQKALMAVDLCASFRDSGVSCSGLLV
jgi:hypothetical protein